MTTVTYKIGDRVRIKSLDWYNNNKKTFGDFKLKDTYFTSSMKHYCGEIMTIENINYIHNEYYYVMLEDGGQYYWIDEMIEGLVEEEILIEKVDDNGLPFNEWLSHKGAFHVPEDYVLKDENGNVINVQKIVLEKKKKEYPKTYEECCKVFGLNHYLGLSWNSYDVYSGVITCLHERIADIAKKLESLSKLLICRDAYWKIAGDEMGLEKPWEPDYTCLTDVRYGLYYALCYTLANPHLFVFPTEEMRNQFYENFKELIENCK